MIQIVQLQSLFARGNQTLSIGTLLSQRTWEPYSSHTKRRKIPHGPLHGTEMIESLQKARDVEAENTSHKHGYGDKGTGNVDCESGVIEERIKHDANRLAARDYAECVECYYEVEWSCAWETDGETAKEGEQEGCDDLQWYFEEGVSQEEGWKWVCFVCIFVVEDLFR